MAALHNRINNQELKEHMLADAEPRTTISFYRYHAIEDPADFRNQLWKALQPLGVLGRIYVAHEGINAQVSVPAAKLEAFGTALDAFGWLQNLRLNVAVDDDGKSFWVLKIKVREKIVADGIDDPAFSMENKGRYLQAEEANSLMSKPDTVILDMRNHYEYEVGHFINAQEVPSDTFREQLPMAAEMMKGKEDANIVMYCTGGIRCEKASAYMLYKGFKNVFHLEGGIINYVNQVKEQNLEQKFVGKNFVFDQRLGERVSDDIIAQCHQCGAPADTHTNCINAACHLLFIQCDACRVKYEGTCSVECMHTIHLPLEEQQKLRRNANKGANIFNKSRARLNKKAPQ